MLPSSATSSLGFIDDVSSSCTPACSSSAPSDAADSLAHSAQGSCRRGSRGNSHLEPDTSGGITPDGHGFLWEVCWNNNPKACRRVSFFPGNGHESPRSSTSTNNFGNHFSGLETNQCPTGRRKEHGLQVLNRAHMQELKNSTHLAKHRCFFASQVFSRDFDSTDSSSESEDEGSYHTLKDIKERYERKYNKLYKQRLKEKDAMLQESLAILQERNKRLQASLDRKEKSLGITNNLMVGWGFLQGGLVWWLYNKDPVGATQVLEELFANPTLVQTLAISPSLLGLAKIMQTFFRQRTGGGEGGGVEKR